MGLDSLEFGVRVRKLMVTSVKLCYRSVWSHPFLIGMVCFLILLYRSFPLLFSLLVAASPVLVCTAVLLGTILSFGSPNIPEIDEKIEEEKGSHEVSSLKTSVTLDDTIVNRDAGDDDFAVERHVGKRWDLVEKADEKVSLVGNDASENEEDDGPVLHKPMVYEDLDSRDIHCENGVIDEVEGRLDDLLVEKKREMEELCMDEAAAKDQHLLSAEAGDRNLEEDVAKLAPDFGDVQIRMGDECAALMSTWKRGGDDEEDEDDDDSIDSGSDGDESSSPDASMADIIPMLDELHPLLGSEAPQPAHIFHDGSDASSERSHGSSDDESIESDEIENHEEDDHEDKEDEGEGAKEDKEDESKAAIKWTEDDQKNLMDLGTSELERNQRLENLIARRRARKNLRLMAQNNLIDLDLADIPLNIAPISTRRRNPFDLPYDSYDDLGLLPIPGSAPSILQPRRNPFDLPYDSSEEKPDLKGDSFQEEFSSFNQREAVSQREAFFRRHESFNVGPSSLSVPRQELKWKPYFVPERLLSEGVSPSSFQRQSSEASESKLSSIPDGDSVSSIVDEDYCRPNEQDVSQEIELVLNRNHASVHDEQESQSSDNVESVDVDQAENRDVRHDVVEITLGDEESQLGMGSSLSEAGAVTLTHVELNASEINPQAEPVEDDYSSRSSFSSLSEIDDKIPDVKEAGSSGFEHRDDVVKESGISTQPSFEESEFHFTSGLVDDNQRREAVYDASPPSVGKFLSFLSVSSDIQAEMDKELGGHDETTAQGSSSFYVIHEASSNFIHEREQWEADLPKIGELDVIHTGSSGISSTSADHNVAMVAEPMVAVEHVSAYAGSSFSNEEPVEDVPDKKESFIQNQMDLSSLATGTTLGVDQSMAEVWDSSPEVQQHLTDHNNESSGAESIDKHAADKKDPQVEQDVIYSSSSLDNNLVEGTVMAKEEIIQTESDQVRLSNSVASLNVDSNHDKGDGLSSADLSYQPMLSNDESSSIPEESGHIEVDKVSLVQPSEAEVIEEHERESGTDQIQPSCSKTEVDTGYDPDMVVEKIPLQSINQDVPSRENSSPELEEQLTLSNNSSDYPSIDDLDKRKEPSIVASESRGEADIVSNDVNVHEAHDSMCNVSKIFPSETSEDTYFRAESSEYMLAADPEDLKYKILSKIDSEGPEPVPEHFNFAADVYGTHVLEENANEEVDEIKDIDEGILSELDTVGDFNVSEFGLSEVSDVAMLPEDIKTETTIELPVLEVRSMEDIDLAFKQLHEGVDVEEVIVPSMIENQQDLVDTNSKLPVVEVRSLEDLHALQQMPESNPAEQPHSLDSCKFSSEVETRDVISSEETEASSVALEIQENSHSAAAAATSNVVSDIQENSEKAAGGLKNQDQEASKNLTISDRKVRKARSDDSSSSSSSSSSDSE